jgi:excisionase family DNA binding protein
MDHKFALCVNGRCSATLSLEARMTPNESDRLLTLPELAERLQVPLASLYSMRSKGTAPRGIRVGRHVRVRLSELERWLDEHSDPRPAA